MVKPLLMSAVMLTLGCSDTAPAPDTLIFPEAVAPIGEELRIWATFRETRVALQDSFWVDIHIVNQTEQTVAVEVGCTQLYFMTVFHEGDEWGIDGAGRCHIVESIYYFAPDDTVTYSMRGWARRAFDGKLYPRGRYELLIGTWSLDPVVPEITASFEVR